MYNVNSSSNESNITETNHCSTDREIRQLRLENRKMKYLAFAVSDHLGLIGPFRRRLNSLRAIYPNGIPATPTGPAAPLSLQASEAGKELEAAPQASAAQPQLRTSDEVTVTARRVEEEAQDVPIPISVLGADIVEKSGDFNVNRLKELLPTVQFYSTNPRNSAINIRGTGCTIRTHQ